MRIPVDFMPDQFLGLYSRWLLTILELLHCRPRFALILHAVVNFSARTQPLTSPNVKVYPKSGLKNRVPSLRSYSKLVST